MNTSPEVIADAKTVIKVESIGKEYRLGEIAKDSIKDSVRTLFSRAKSEKETFWALKDVSFEVKEGEVLGIVGRNGAGKSTLLKVLSRITYPTEGKIEIVGRVASLLEVGTGFHPELTGRENVFLNGSILGMSRKEIRQKFDEIVAFSGVEKFIDTPVKRYSSGMYVRLAFSVAAHLEPEILIIDEVLAVGDAEFQKKCLGKMKDVAGEGRTVLFVSHNMAAVKSLCTSAIVLEKGKMVFNGNTNEAVHVYMHGDAEVLNRKIFSEDVKNRPFKLHEISVNNSGRKFEEPLTEDLPIELHTKISFERGPQRYHITYHMHNELGEDMFSFGTFQENLVMDQGESNLTCYFPTHFFQSGQYFLTLLVVEDGKKVIFKQNDIMSFTVLDGGRKIGAFMGREPGYIRPKFQWKNEKMEVR